jgi:hypothetical protein
MKGLIKNIFILLLFFISPLKAVIEVIADLDEVRIPRICMKHGGSVFLYEGFHFPLSREYDEKSNTIVLNYEDSCLKEIMSKKFLEKLWHFRIITRPHCEEGNHWRLNYPTYRYTFKINNSFEEKVNIKKIIANLCMIERYTPPPYFKEDEVGKTEVLYQQKK